MSEPGFNHRFVSDVRRGLIFVYSGARAPTRCHSDRYHHPGGKVVVHLGTKWNERTSAATWREERTTENAACRRAQRGVNGVSGE